MDKGDALDLAVKYANAVKSKYDFVKIILFGSYAKATTMRIATLILQ